MDVRREKISLRRLKTWVYAKLSEKTTVMKTYLIF